MNSDLTELNVVKIGDSLYFYKHPDGSISVSGLITLPTTLPESLRPKKSVFLIATPWRSTATEYVYIDTTGVVTAGDSGVQTGSYFICGIYN